jgi:hypothetical protein
MVYADAKAKARVKSDIAAPKEPLNSLSNMAQWCH